MAEVAEAPPEVMPQAPGPIYGTGAEGLPAPAIPPEGGEAGATWEAAPATSPFVAGSQAPGLQAQVQSRIAQSDAALAAANARMGALGAPPPPPEFQKLPDAPKYNPVPTLEAFGSAAAAFGVLAGMLSRRPLVAAMQGAAAAINGMQDGNIEQYKNGIQEWKLNTEKALNENKIVSDQYKAVLDNRRLTMEEIAAQIRTIAAAHQDTNTLAMMRNNDMTNFVRMEGDRLQAESRVRAAQINTERTFRMSPMGQALSSLPPDATPEQQRAATQRVRINPVAEAKQQELQNKFIHTIANINSQIDLVQQHVNNRAQPVTGPQGRLSYYVDAAGNLLNSAGEAVNAAGLKMLPSAGTLGLVQSDEFRKYLAANQQNSALFRQNAALLRTALPELLNATNHAGGAQFKMLVDQIAPAQEWGATDANVLVRLGALRAHLLKSIVPPAGIPVGSELLQLPNGSHVWTYNHPSGVKDVYNLDGTYKGRAGGQ